MSKEHLFPFNPDINMRRIKGVHDLNHRITQDSQKQCMQLESMQRVEEVLILDSQAMEMLRYALSDEAQKKESNNRMGKKEFICNRKRFNKRKLTPRRDFQK